MISPEEIQALQHIKQDIQQAFMLQQSLMPCDQKLATINKRYGIDIDYIFTPSLHLSGDLWGIIPLDHHCFGLWLCDFVGKGLHAALSTFRIHTLIQDIEQDICYNPQVFLYILNNKLCKMLDVGNFATCLYGIMDVQAGVFHFVSAGGTSPLVYHPDDKTYQLIDHGGLPLGIQPHGNYPVKTVSLHDQAQLILYSDVLWENDQTLGICFDAQHIDTFIKSLNGADILQHIRRRMTQTLANPQLSDDLTLIQISLS